MELFSLLFDVDSVNNTYLVMPRKPAGTYIFPFHRAKLIWKGRHTLASASKLDRDFSTSNFGLAKEYIRT
jgi:hypothetical protein